MLRFLSRVSHCKLESSETIPIERAFRSTGKNLGNSRPVNEINFVDRIRNRNDKGQRPTTYFENKTCTRNSKFVQAQSCNHRIASGARALRCLAMAGLQLDYAFVCVRVHLCTPLFQRARACLCTIIYSYVHR